MSEVAKAPSGESEGAATSASSYGEPRAVADDAATFAARFRGAMERVRLGEAALAQHGGGVAGARVLDLGANLGHEAVCLAALGAAEVTGSDFGDDFTAGLAERQARTVALYRAEAAALGVAADRATTPIRFLLDDVAASRLPEASFDAICSWQTLEHLVALEAAFAGMRRLLRPGGLMYHEYHAYFGLDGGHALCTTDVPWGHVQGGRAGLEAWLRAAAPDRCEAALAFHDRALGRYTIAGTRRAAERAGLEVLLLLPRARTEDLLKLDAATLEAARRHHPELEVVDLVSRMVRLVLRRP